MRNPLLSLVFAVACVAGCGASDGPPPPLSKHFQDSYIAQLPVDKQSEVLKAQNEFNVAQREKAKAEADLREAQLLLDVAKNEAKAAKLDEESARTRHKAAEQSADMNRVNDATREKRGAELASNAADERVKYYTAYRTWLHRLLRYTEENAYWRESQYELAKAKLAQDNNIAPAGFRYDDYVKQEADRGKRTQSARGKAEDLKEKAVDSRNRWVAVQTEADRTLGKATQFPDPMSPDGKAVRGADPTAGATGTTVGGEGSKTDEKVQPAENPATPAPKPEGEPKPAGDQKSGGGTQ